MQWNCSWKNCTKQYLEPNQVANYRPEYILISGYTNVQIGNFTQTLNTATKIGLATGTGTADLDGVSHQLKIEISVSDITDVFVASAGDLTHNSIIATYTKGIAVYGYNEVPTDVSIKITDITLGKVLQGDIEFQLEDLDNYGANKWEGFKPSSATTFEKSTANPATTANPVPTPPDGIFHRMVDGYYTGFDADADISNSLLFFTATLGDDWTVLGSYKVHNTQDAERRYFDLSVDKINFSKVNKSVEYCSQEINLHFQGSNCSSCEYQNLPDTNTKVVRRRFKTNTGAFEVSPWTLYNANVPYYEKNLMFSPTTELFDLNTLKYPFIFDSQERRDCENIDIKIHTCVNEECTNLPMCDVVEKHELNREKENCYTTKSSTFDRCGNEIKFELCWDKYFVDKYESDLCGINENLDYFKWNSNSGNCDYMSKFDFMQFFMSLLKEPNQQNALKNQLKLLTLNKITDCSGIIQGDLENKTIIESINSLKTKVDLKLDKNKTLDILATLNENQVRAIFKI